MNVKLLISGLSGLQLRIEEEQKTCDNKEDPYIHVSREAKS